MKTLTITILVSFFSLGTFASDLNKDSLQKSSQEQIWLENIDEIINVQKNIEPTVIKVYNASFELVYKTEVLDPTKIKDKTLKKLLRKSTYLLGTEDTSLYRLNG